MKITLIILAVIALTASTFAQSSNDSSTEPSSTKTSVGSSSTSPIEVSSTTTTVSSTSSSSTPASTASSTPAPTSTASSTPVPTTTSSTPVPTTTASSSSEPTTTASPTTSPETTTTQETTSVLPTTSTASPVTSTKTPIPVPETGYWNVTEGNTTCIRAKLAIRFKIELEGKSEYVVLSAGASSEKSKCNTSDGTEELVLQDSEYMVMFVFEKKSDSVYVKNTSFTFYLPPSVTETFTNDSHMFDVKAGSSYLCNTQSNVILGNVTMEILSIQIQAFGAENNKDFGAADECGADNPINDIVPIAVGVALLALVVVVLIAYLVGRRRSRQKGYQSV